MAQTSNIDDAEISRFAALAGKWWEPDGAFASLHKLGPARMRFIRDQIIGHFGALAGTSASKPVGSGPDSSALSGLSILDVGCGGGLVCEPLARLGATVTGIDPAPENIEAARLHAELEGLDILYRDLRAEDLAEAGATFDVVVSLEVVEHVPDGPAFLETCHKLVRPGGLFITSTISKTLKSYALAIVAAEYILDWVPRGTHDWNRFVSPEDLARMLRSAGFPEPDFKGMTYDIGRDAWSLSNDLSVNYLAAAAKPCGDNAVSQPSRLSAGTP